ncbi:hypothetical protein NP590_02075 [Methylomonas sp. SURF-2]|uniref:Uncharacterized protein n=1 Tax=Methylomonas subterranea TaxID=2952225 RepID=A0ABT1TC61_9GAMM|nr:hypothetical protein [Methylomonas sp. SURF-2]MCQ8102879.1 hypothetical protein [Methylomonas sp. SURF-2]
MKHLYLILFAAAFSLRTDAVFAYGSSSSSASCDKPTFSEFQPAVNKYIQSFREFAFVASSNTSPSSIEVNISAGQIKEHFSAKQLEITPQPSGRLMVKGKINKPFQHGFVRLSATAHSKPGCEKTDGVLLRVQ